MVTDYLPDQKTSGREDLIAMAVVELEITRRTSLADGKPFGSAGPYEYLTGIVRFAIDPEDPRNAGIMDLKLASRGEDGRVRFTSDFALMKPVRPERGNGRLLFDVPNRGRKVALTSFNKAGIEPDDPNAGNAFLMRQGYTVAWAGWQHDVLGAWRSRRQRPCKTVCGSRDRSCVSFRSQSLPRCCPSPTPPTGPILPIMSPIRWPSSPSEIT